MIIKLDNSDLEIAREILAIQSASYKVESKIINYKDLPPLKEDCSSIRTCMETFVGYYSCNRLVAVISYKEITDSIEICRLVVHPSSFGKGFATKLLHHLLQKQPKQMTVCTAAKNSPALKLYKKLGFQIVKIFEVENGLQLVKLEKINEETAI
ncbi:GNAT family N-acetyltransferase [Niallia sp. 01092]|uniref:GNAT family N-acetyltransferase n=1 Tax=unclassified Niallia TaxID=2837522 RepID=UPI003FD62C24